MKAISFGLAAAFLGLVLGFFAFLYQVSASKRLPRGSTDVIVVFSGDPRRVIAATDLLKSGYGRRLLVVGQDNGNEIEAMRIENPSLFGCCVEIDKRSRNTAEDAVLVRNFVMKTRARSLLLVTSSFHVPRARKELRRLIPEIHIASFGVADGFFKTEDIFSNPNVGPAFVSEYLKFLAVSVPSAREVIGENNGRKLLQFTSSIMNLALVIITIFALIVAAVAFLKHRTRHHEPPNREKN